MRSPPFLVGAALALLGDEHHVFRAALFSIVLTLAVGHNASLLCQVWCPEPTAAECPHGDSTSPRVSADDSCRRAVVEAVAFVRDDARRTEAPDAPNALVIARFRLIPSPADLGSALESGRQRPLEERPLVIALRI